MAANFWGFLVLCVLLALPQCALGLYQEDAGSDDWVMSGLGRVGLVSGVVTWGLGKQSEAQTTIHVASEMGVHATLDRNSGAMGRRWTTKSNMVTTRMTEGRYGALTSQVEIVHSSTELTPDAINNSRAPTRDAGSHQIESVSFQFTDTTRGGVLWQWHRTLVVDDEPLGPHDRSALCFDAALTQRVERKVGPAAGDSVKMSDTVLMLDGGVLTANSVGRGVTGVNKARAGLLWSVNLYGLTTAATTEGDSTTADTAPVAQSPAVVDALTALRAQNAQYCSIVVEPVALQKWEGSVGTEVDVQQTAFVLGSVPVGEARAWVSVEVNLETGQILGVVKIPQMLSDMQPTSSLFWDARLSTELSLYNALLDSTAKAVIVDSQLLAVNNGNLFVASLKQSSRAPAEGDETPDNTSNSASAFNLKSMISKVHGITNAELASAEMSADWRVLSPGAAHAAYRGAPNNSFVLCNGHTTMVVQLISSNTAKVVKLLQGRWVLSLLTSFQQFPKLKLEGYIPSDTTIALGSTHGGFLQVLGVNVLDGDTTPLLESKAIIEVERGDVVGLAVSQNSDGCGVVASFGDHSLISLSTDAGAATNLHWIREEGLASVMSVVDFHVSRSRIREILGHAQPESQSVTGLLSLSSKLPVWVVEYIPYLLEFEALLATHAAAAASPAAVVKSIIGSMAQELQMQFKKIIVTEDPRLKTAVPKRVLDPLYIPISHMLPRGPSTASGDMSADEAALLQSSAIAEQLHGELAAQSTKTRLTDPLRIALLSSCAGKVFAVHLSSGRILWWRSVGSVEHVWPAVAPSSFCTPTTDTQPQGVSASINGRASTNLGSSSRPTSYRHVSQIAMVDSAASAAPAHRQEPPPQHGHEDHHRKLMTVSSFFDKTIGTYRLKSQLLDPLTGGIEAVHTFSEDVDRVIPLAQNANLGRVAGTNTTGTVGAAEGGTAAHWKSTVYLLLKRKAVGGAAGAAEVYDPERSTGGLLQAALQRLVFYEFDALQSALWGMQYSIAPDTAANQPSVPLVGRRVWYLNFNDSGESIISVTSFQHSEYDHVPAIIHGASVDVLHRYINANLLAVLTTKSTTGSTAVQVTLHVVNGVDGEVLLSHELPDGATTPMQVLAVDNTITTRYFNLHNRRQELSTVDMYYPYTEPGPWQLLTGLAVDNMSRILGSYGQRLATWMRARGYPASLTEAMTIDADRPAVSAVGGSTGAELPVPNAMAKTYVFPGSIHQMGITATAQGVTPRLLIMTSSGGQVHSIPYRMLSAHRRNTDQSAKSMQAAIAEDGVPPYAPLLPKVPANALSYSLQVMHPRGVASYPGLLESTTSVLVFGLDLFYRATQPAKGFDALNGDFNRAFLLVAVAALFAAAVVTRRMAKSAKLYRVWA